MSFYLITSLKVGRELRSNVSSLLDLFLVATVTAKQPLSADTDLNLEVCMHYFV